MKAKLGDYIQEYSVRNKVQENIPVCSVTNAQGFCQDYFGKEVASKDKSTYKIVPRGCFAYNPSRINVGSVDWQRHWDRVIVSPLYNVFSVSPQLNQQYLYYYLKSKYALQRIRTVATGSVRDNLKLEMLREFPISVPSIEEQQSIVRKLDGIKRITTLHEQKLQLLDKLIKARFVEMFGDSIYPFKTLIEVIKVGAGISYGIVVPGENTPDGVPMIRPSDFKNGALDLSNVYRVDPKIEKKYSRTRLIGDEVLVQVIGQPGKVMLSTYECKGMNITRNLAVIRPNHEIVNQVFLKAFIEKEESQQFLLQNTKQSTLKQLPLNRLKMLAVKIPPYDLQNQFATFVSQVDESKLVVQKALDQAQLLYDSLMQEYFG